MNAKNLALVFGFLVPLLAHSQGMLTADLSNVGESAGGSVLFGSDLWIAQSFNTGTDFDGYTMNLLLINGSGGFTSSVSIYSDSHGAPGSELGVSGFTLSPAATYWIVATASTPASSSFPSYSWSYASDNNYSSNDNWSINPTYDLSTDGTNWESYSDHSPFQFYITSTPVPEPSICALAGLGLAVICLRKKK